MAEYVTVTIVGEEKVRYHQTKRMPKEEFDRLNSMLDSKDRKEQAKANELIGGLWIDRFDVFGSDDFEIDEFKVSIDA